MGYERAVCWVVLLLGMLCCAWMGETEAITLPMTPKLGADQPVVQTTYGPVAGFEADNYDVSVFLGIPFATPPTGSLRWTSPQPPTPWTDTLQATEFQSACAQACQLPPIMCPQNVSEDCLYLDVYTPSGFASMEPMPVMVFIAGGAFIQGAGTILAYNGAYLANISNTVIVNSNYRLGAFGFLVTDQLGGNFGIQDQRLMLQWVQDNIKAFGGDPTQVTLFGESAGAMSVGWHMASPLSKGLFSKAIMESNPFGIPYKNTAESIPYGEAFAQYIGCVVSDLDCLRSKTTEEAIVAGDKTSVIPDPFNLTLTVALAWTPVVDGIDLAVQPVYAFENGLTVDIPTIMGTNSAEGIMFIYLAFGSPISSVEYVGIVTALFGLDNLSDVLEYYPGSLSFDDQNRPTLSRLVTDYVFYCATRHMLSSLQAQESSVYAYRFNHAFSFDPWGPRYPFCVGQACHGVELPFVFNSAAAGGYEFTPAELQLSEQMAGYWVNFAHTGDPNSGPVTVQTSWPEFSPSNLEDLLLDLDISVESGHNATVCDFWDSVGYQI